MSKTIAIILLARFFLLLRKLPFAKLGDWAGFTSRGPCRADVTSELYDPMAEIRLLFGFDQLGKNFFDLMGVLQGRVVHAKATANADAMGVCYHGRLTVNVSEKEIGDLSSNTGERQQLVHGIGDAAVVLVAQNGASLLDACRLGTEESARADQIFNRR